MATKKTPEVIKRLLDGIADGKTLRALCREDGMPNWRTVYDWIEADADLAARIAHARELGFDAIAEDILDIADDGTNDWIERQRNDGSTELVIHSEHVQRSKLRIETRLKLLAKWSPNRYGDNATLNLGNKNGEALKIETQPADPMVVSALTKALLSQKSDA